MTDKNNVGISLQDAISQLQNTLAPPGADKSTPAIAEALKALDTLVGLGESVTEMRVRLEKLVEKDVSRENLFNDLGGFLAALQEIERACNATAKQISDKLR